MTADVHQFCPKCGRQRQGEEKFCPNDGTSYEAASSATPQAPTPVVPSGASTKKTGGFRRMLGIGCLGIIGLVVLISVAGAVAGGGKSPGAQQNTGSQQSQAPAGSSGQSNTQATSDARTVATAAAAPKLGQPYASGNWEYTVHGVTRMKEIGSQFLKDTAKGEYAVVGVTLKNVGRQNFGISGHDFELYDGSGVKYDTAVAIAADQWAKANGYDGGVLTLTTGQMPPGVPVKYAVLFDVAPGAQGLHLRLVQAKVDVPLG